MTPEEQRIAIAAVCVIIMKCCRCGHRTDKSATLIKYDAPFCSEDCAERASDYTLEDGAESIPDYLNDLNAMHEAENNLAVNKAPEYGRQLALVCERDYSAANRLGMGYNLWHATAAQRAEAFLKAKGLWT